MTITLDGTLGITTPGLTTPKVDLGSTTTSSLGAGNSSIMKNRIINGAMVIDQRNAGAAVGTSINGYTVDRWALYANPTGKVNGGQNYNSVTPPAGFTNYLGFQSQSAYTIGASEYVLIRQNIEGFNTADLAWGTANAKTVTLSFWVYSSLTGTFGGSLFNPNQGTTVCYPFSYSISSANTWQQISVTIAGPTSGTFGTSNSGGVGVTFSLASGSSVSGTAGAWVTANYYSATGATSVVGTNGATFYITGVQLEVGTSATGFEYVNYQTLLANCQRYYENSNGSGGTISSADAYVVTASSTQFATFTYKVGKRIAPTMTYSFAGGTGATFAISNGSFYQSAAHSVASTFGWTASAEL